MVNPGEFIGSRGEGSKQTIWVRWSALGSTIVATILAGNFVGAIDIIRGLGRGIAQATEDVGRWVEVDLIGGLLSIPNDTYEGIWDAHATWISSTFGPFALLAIAVETFVLAYLFVLGLVFVYNAVIGGLG